MRWRRAVCRPPAGGAGGQGRGSDTGYRSPPPVLICCIARPATAVPLSPHLHTSTHPPLCPSRTHVPMYAVCGRMHVFVGYYVLGTCVGGRPNIMYARFWYLPVFLKDTLLEALLTSNVLRKETFYRIIYITRQSRSSSQSASRCTSF